MASAQTSSSKRSLRLVAGLIVALAIAGAFFWRSRGTQKLTEKDSILLADFVNTTGDPVFDGTLKQALAVQLEQSPYLNIAPDQTVRKALQFMGRPADERVTGSVAREICEREHMKAMLSGSIASLGSQYVIALDATNCASGDSLAREQVTAATKEAVLAAVGKAASSLRGKLGESLATIQKFDTPVTEATTSSLEALKAYAAADEMRNSGGEAESMPLFQHAVELDPNFAMAYARMGAIYGNLGESTLAEENAQKAFDLRERTSELERFYITAHYHESVTGESQKEIENYELWIQTYPRDWTPRNNIVNNYIAIGEFQKALAQALETLRLESNDILPYQVTIGSYLHLNQLEEAKAIYKQAVDRIFDSVVVHFHRFQIAYLEGDKQEMERQAAWASGNTEESTILLAESQVAASRGQLKKSRELSQLAFDSAKKNGLQSAAALAAAGRAVVENWMGDPAAAKSWSAQALDLSNDQLTSAAASLAWAGDSTRPERIIDVEGKKHPKNTVLQQGGIPQVRAAIAIKRGNPAAAVEALKPASQLELNDLGPTFYRGLAYLNMKQGKDAAAEFKKIIDRKTIQPISPLHPLSQLELARSLALTGDTAGARTAYQDFLAQWKDADPDLPLLTQAKAEYAKLQ